MIAVSVHAIHSMFDSIWIYSCQTWLFWVLIFQDLVTKQMFMHLHTITLTFAKGILLLWRGADDQLCWHLVVWANKRRLLSRIYSTRLLQKVVDFTLDDQWSGGNLRFWYFQRCEKISWLAYGDVTIFFNQLWIFGFYVTRKGELGCA